jgi:hypothetical protein
VAKQEDLRETAWPHFSARSGSVSLQARDLTNDADRVATIESEVGTIAMKRLVLGVSGMFSVWTT